MPGENPLLFFRGEGGLGFWIFVRAMGGDGKTLTENP